MSLITVDYHTAEACVIEAFRTKKVPYIKGSPGTGKSKLYHSIAKRYKLFLIDLRLANMEPTDLMGYPFAKDKKANYLPMETFPLEGDPVPEGYTGFLLLLDEINQAERPTIKAAYKLVLDRMVGPYKLHPKCWVAMAGNLDTDNALTEEMGTAMQSRISPHLQLEVNAKQWLEWANTEGIDYRITSFIEFRPDLLHHFEADHIDCTYPCPRTWEYIHDYIQGQQLDSERLKTIHMPLIAGTIGSGAAMEFVAFTKMFERLPKLHDILTDPIKVEFHNTPDVVYALTGMLANSASVGNIEDLLKFVDRLSGEFQALTIRTIRQRNPDLTHHSAITAWITKNADALVA